MKKVFSLFIILLLTINSKLVLADLLSDTNTIFDWAEIHYPQYFSPSGQETKFIDQWRYRYYPDNKNYVGVNDDESVYILGNLTNGELQRVDSVVNLLIQVNQSNASSGSSCGSIPLVASGTKYVWTTSAQGISFTSEITHNQVSTTSSKETIVSQGTTTTTEQNFSISNNIISTTKITTNTSVQGFNLSTESTFSPAKTAIAFDYCVSQTHNNSYTISTVTSGGTTTSEQNEAYVVVSVDESLTTAGGTFSTVKIKLTVTSDGETFDAINWFDKATGILVKNETYDVKGALSSTTEVSSF